MSSLGRISRINHFLIPLLCFHFPHSFHSFIFLIHFSLLFFIQHSTSFHTVPHPAVHLSCTPAHQWCPVLCSCSSSVPSVFPSFSFPLSETRVSKATIPLSSSPADGAPSPSTAQRKTSQLPSGGQEMAPLIYTRAAQSWADGSRRIHPVRH